MDSRLAFFLLGAVVVAGVSAAGPECPPGFRCAGAPAASGTACRIEEGPFRGETGTLVDGRCLRSSDSGAGGLHTHVIEAGRCPLCGEGGEEFLTFHVQGGSSGPAAGASGSPAGASGSRLARYEARRILRCTVCGNLFAN